MAKILVNIIFTNEQCRECKNGIWKKIDCDKAISHTAEILREKHEVYVCSANCGVPGYKTEIYRL